jgi:hypothetical protein
MLSEKELRDHFNMPLNEVAKKFGMCTTALKKLCRKYGVMQWPHRKLRSLEKKIASLRAEQVTRSLPCLVARLHGRAVNSRPCSCATGALT